MTTEQTAIEIAELLGLGPVKSDAARAEITLTHAEARRLLVLARTQPEPPTLTTAFHTVYDLKDESLPGSQAFYDAYLAVQAIERLMPHWRIPVPARHDAKREV